MNKLESLLTKSIDRYKVVKDIPEETLKKIRHLMSLNESNSPPKKV